MFAGTTIRLYRGSTESDISTTDNELIANEPPYGSTEGALKVRIYKNMRRPTDRTTIRLYRGSTESRSGGRRCLPDR